MLLDRHRAKIKTVPALRAIIGPRPRARTVVLCHGVFDIVHPGHLRHLLYAHGKADILVASLTADYFVAKGEHRPHVPQELRALNLAMIDVVDYVVVGDAERPDHLLADLQPDYYAKGFEYSETAQPGRTINEVAVVTAYGGEVLFTPGDYVQSSTALLELSRPNLAYEKLQLVMERYAVTFDYLRRTLDAVSQTARVHVVGDVIVDRYTRCALIGCSSKTPTISSLYEAEDAFVGGAGIVSKHLAEAGAPVTLSTVVGLDRASGFVLDDLHSAGVEVDALVDETRPTTVKEVITVGGQRMLKVDRVDNRSISDSLLDRLVEAVSETEAGATVFSDFRHGIFNSRTIQPLCDAIPSGRRRIADSQVASRWGNVLDFVGFDLITPNEREARFALGDQDSGVRPLASQLYSRAGCGALILKLGERGALTCLSSDYEDVNSFFALDSFAGTVVDPVGAGDALLAYAALGLQISGDPVVATILGVFAAGLECEFDGNVPIRSDYVKARIDEIERES